MALAASSVAILAAICLICDSKYNIQHSQYELFWEELPPELDGFRIVHLSDLHGALFGEDNERLVDLVRRQQPDLIALTGDFAGSREELPAMEALASGLQGLAPAYYVAGNHEWAGGCVEDARQILERYGVCCLSNQYEPLNFGGARLIVAGAEDPNGRADMERPDSLAQRLRQDYPEDFVLWLGHRNYWVERYPELPVELVLCGHAHGGIIRLPLIGGLFSTKHSLGAEYETGLYYSGSYIMEVSRGLGNSILIPRLFNRPELVTIILRSGQPSA